jgi:hypothetical protein
MEHSEQHGTFRTTWNIQNNMEHSEQHERNNVEETTWKKQHGRNNMEETT